MTSAPLPTSKPTFINSSHQRRLSTNEKIYVSKGKVKYFDKEDSPLYVSKNLANESSNETPSVKNIPR